MKNTTKIFFIGLIFFLPATGYADSNWGTMVWNQDNWSEPISGIAMPMATGTATPQIRWLITLPPLVMLSILPTAMM